MQTHHHDRTNALSTMPYSTATSLPIPRPPHFTPMGLLLSHHNPAACNRPGDGMCLCVRARARCGRRWSKSSTPPLGSTDARFHDRGTSTHRHIDSDLCPRRRRLRGCRSAEVRGAPVVQHQNPAVRPARIPTQRPAAAATNARRLPPRRREPAAEKRWIHRLPAAAAPKRWRPTASGADAQIVEDPASSNTVDEKLKFALKVRDSMLRDAVDAASRFTVS